MRSDLWWNNLNCRTLSLGKIFLFQVVTDESVPKQTAVQDRGGLYKFCKQSEPSQSLYCLMQDLQRLSLQDEG